jgi:RNA polymerase primary sigma factor
MAKAAVTAKPKGQEDVGSSLEALMASASSLRRLVTQAKAKGSITLDQLNAALPPDTNPEQIDELISGLEARGIGERERSLGKIQTTKKKETKKGVKS